MRTSGSANGRQRGFTGSKREECEVKVRRIQWCRMDLPGPTTSVGTRTDYSVGPWDYPACATRLLKAWSTRTTEEKYSVRKLYMSCTVWKTPRRTRLVLSLLRLVTLPPGLYKARQGPFSRNTTHLIESTAHYYAIL
jgi:hypothetical protein